MIWLWAGLSVLGAIGLIALALITKTEMDGDFKEYDKSLHIKHIERMDKETK